MASSSSRVAFTAALLLFGIGLQVQAFKFPSIPAVSRRFLGNSVCKPQTCYCAKSSSKNEGTCLYMDKGQCKSRPCESSYECKSGVKTDTLCICRKTTTKLVMVHPGVCEKKPISGVQYVPYNSGPNLGTGGSGATRGLYFVVAGRKVVYRTKYLNKAKKYLRRYKRGSRAIFEVKKGKVLKSPYRIAGYPQTRRYGFYTYWRNKKDIQRMRNICVKYIKPKRKPVFRTKNVQGLYLVVVLDTHKR